MIENERRILRLPELKEIVGLSRASIYRLMDKGVFPRPASSGGGVRAVGWRSDEIAKWIEDRQRSGGWK